MEQITLLFQKAYSCSKLYIKTIVKYAAIDFVSILFIIDNLDNLESLSIFWQVWSIVLNTSLPKFTTFTPISILRATVEWGCGGVH